MPPRNRVVDSLSQFATGADAVRPVAPAASIFVSIAIVLVFACSPGRSSNRRSRADGRGVFEVVERRILRFVGRAIALLALLGGVAWLVLAAFRPNLIVCRFDASESAAIATLKNLHAAQQRFAELGVVDRDGDGRGEFGTLGELAGAVDLRCALAGVAAPRRLAPALLGASFGADAYGRTQRTNYLFQVWLSAGDGRWIGDGSGGPGPTYGWCAYAWPADGARAKRAFFIDHVGELHAFDNVDRTYHGVGRPALVDAALPSSDAHARATPGECIGRDGRLWRVVE